MYSRSKLGPASLLLLVLFMGACRGAPRRETVSSTTVAPLGVAVDTWRPLVSPEAFEVLFHEATERPFSSPLYEEHRPGTFVCAACRLPLFESRTKYDSGTGWPSFWQPIAGHVGFQDDHKLLEPRTEYHCARCGGHQGHVFDDGPKPTGQRWCNNGVALEFVPAGEPLPPLRGGQAADGETAARSGVATGAGAAAGAAARNGAATGNGAGAAAGAATIAVRPATSDTAIFAGGCFWCLETAFEGVPGVLSAVSGYTGGHVPNPTYEQVCTHTTGHVEAVRVAFDPKLISYDQLLDHFWVNVDPTDDGGQFCDRANTYVSAIFYRDDAQKRQAELSEERAAGWLKSKRPIVTSLRPAAPFYEAEEYHQDFFRKDPERYQSYRLGCGRDARLKQLWGERAHH